MPPAALAAKSPSPVPIACDHEQEADVPERNGNDGPALQHNRSQFVGPADDCILSHDATSENIAAPGRPGGGESYRDQPMRQRGNPHSRAYAASFEFGCA